MRIFTLAEAGHYCQRYYPRGGDAELEVETFRKRRIPKPRQLREGEAIFEEFRCSSLQEAERCLFLAASQYRRSLDLMLASSAPWAHVTLYYGAWYCAHAISSMVGLTVLGGWIVDVESGTPGKQVLRVRRIGRGQGEESSTYKGSHQRFWDLFYRAMAPLSLRVQPSHSVGLTPVANDITWQISQRNEINYNTSSALKVVVDFDRSFNRENFPSCLPGPLGTQYRLLEALLGLSMSLAARVGLATDALADIGSPGSLSEKVLERVFHCAAPGLVSHSEKRSLFGR